MFDTEVWKGRYRDAVQEKPPGEEVEAAWLFYRTGGYAALALGPLSPIAATISRTVGKKRAGGLPNQFLLALTPDRVYAFKSRSARTRAKAGKELAVWERSGLRVTTEDAALNTTVTLEAPAEGEKIRCSTGKDATSREFLALLSQSSAASAAA